MHLNDYMHAAMSFRLAQSTDLYALHNLPAEVGELMSLEAKMIRDGGDWNEHRRKVLKELGDILWTLTAVAQDYEFSLDEVAKGNIEKLRNRKNNNTIQGNGDDR